MAKCPTSVFYATEGEGKGEAAGEREEGAEGEREKRSGLAVGGGSGGEDARQGSVEASILKKPFLVGMVG